MLVELFNQFDKIQTHETEHHGHIKNLCGSHKENMSEVTPLPEHPALAFQFNEKIGRLYHKPGFVVPDHLTHEKVKQLLISGDLMPSTTNVIGVKNSPHLLTWYAKMAAEEAVDFVLRDEKVFLEGVKRDRGGAIKYLRDTAVRYRDSRAALGSNVHNACDLLLWNQPIDMSSYTEYETACINSYKDWLNKFQPTPLFTEVTGFGQTRSKKLSYANTTDLIVEINGQTAIGEIKCVVDSTPILMANGSTKKASEIEENDVVVGWNEQTGLIPSRVSYVGSNGIQQTVTVGTSSGHKLTTTLNHPYWAARPSRDASWVLAEELSIGDEVHVAMGWNYSQHRQEQAWPFRKNLSPYLLGILWSLRNFIKQDLREADTIELPNLARKELYEELRENKFVFMGRDSRTINVKETFVKLAKRNKMTVEEFYDVVDVTHIPEFVSSASAMHLSAFFSGVREVFTNRDIYADEIVIVLNKKALRSLQQLFVNYGQPAKVFKDQKSGLNYLKVPYDKPQTIYTHGPSVVKITSIKMNVEPEHTVAIEVAGCHTHVTSGIITHNTNRGGLPQTAGLQLAANKNNDTIVIDDELTPMPKIDTGFGLHISPNGVKTQRLNIDDTVRDTFDALREAWDYAVFDGELYGKDKNFQNILTKPEDF